MLGFAFGLSALAGLFVYNSFLSCAVENVCGVNSIRSCFILFLVLVFLLHLHPIPRPPPLSFRACSGEAHGIS